MQIVPKFFDSLTRGAQQNEALPYKNTLDEYLDILLPELNSWGEDLSEQHHFVGKNWMEVRDDESFRDVVLHVFNEGGEYWKVVNGDINRGSWQLREGNNQIVINMELYKLGFLGGDFFVLIKHGNHIRRAERKYFVMGSEKIAAKLTWREYIELMSTSYKNSSNVVIIIAAIILVIIAVFVIFSIF